MTIAEAKERITSEFIRRFDEWFDDLHNLPDAEYGRKYGWRKTEKVLNFKKNQAAYIYFQSYIWCGYAEWGMWLHDGYDRDTLNALTEEKFLSYEQKKWIGYCFISQATAKQIYRDRRTQA